MKGINYRIIKIIIVKVSIKDPKSDPKIIY